MKIKAAAAEPHAFPARAGKMRFRAAERGSNPLCTASIEAAHRAEDAGVCRMKIGAELAELRAFED